MFLNNIDTLSENAICLILTLHVLKLGYVRQLCDK